MKVYERPQFVCAECGAILWMSNTPGKSQTVEHQKDILRAPGYPPCIQEGESFIWIPEVVAEEDTDDLNFPVGF